MTGKPGMTGQGMGGRRDGAGRKPKATKLRNGQGVGVWEMTPDGPVFDQSTLGIVEIVKRGTFKIVMNNGTTYTIITN
jgi:hypothetical protein